MARINSGGGSATGGKLSYQQMQAQKDKNSAAWHTAATQAEKDRLHQQNLGLQSQMDKLNGTSTSFDSGTGTYKPRPPASNNNNAQKQPPAATPQTPTTTTRPPAAGAPNGFTGSANGVTVFDDAQKADIDQMNANSREWHTASPERRKWLEKENERLAAGLGDNVRHDPNTGLWTGTSKNTSGTGEVSSTTLEKENEHSAWLEEMERARQEAALANLEAVYNGNVAALDQAQGKIAPGYQDARNQTLGASGIAKRNFAEYAAASGLNSGAGGQAELANSLTLQNNLNQIGTAEQDAIADLELQRTQTEIDYNNAIAQAKATGDYELARALYEEKVRVDEAMRQRQYQQWMIDNQTWQTNYATQQDVIANQQYADKVSQQGADTDYERREAMALNAAKWGYFDLLADIGYPPEVIAGMKQEWDRQNAGYTPAPTRTGTGGGYSGGGGNESRYVAPPKPDDTPKPPDSTETAGAGWVSSVNELGLGPISEGKLRDMISTGAVEVKTMGGVTYYRKAGTANTWLNPLGQW